MRLLLAGLCLFWTTAAPAETPYPDNRQLQRRISALVSSSNGLAQEVVLGKSLGGRPIMMLVLAGPGKADARPAMLIVGGLDGSHLLGTDLALAAARQLIGKQSKLLSNRTVYIVPRANPDGVARFLRNPRAGYAGNDRKIDRDRDGSKAEDGPSDLDGDGLILQMRVKDPEGTWFADPTEPRLLRKADPAKGQRGVYKLYREGTDRDGDGERNEDWADGVDPNRNFAHRYDMHQDDAGRFPSSAPSARLLMDLLVSRPNIGLVLVYGLDDNLVKPPAAGKVKGRRPMVKLDPDDLPYYKQLGKAYQKQTKTKGKPRKVPGGTFFEWCYFHRGLPSFAVRGWHAPPKDKKKKAAKGKDKNKNKDKDKDTKKDAKEEKSKAKKKKDKPHPDQSWIQYADKLKTGFKAWTEYKHPTLGSVEIGGFLPGFRINPPAAAVAKICQAEAPFAGHLLGQLPEVALVEVKVVKLADGLFRISAVVVNDGKLPAILAQGRRNRAVRPVVVELLGSFTLIGARPAGQKMTLISKLNAMGGRRKLSWVIRATGKVTLQMRTGRGYEARKEVVLR